MNRNALLIGIVSALVGVVGGFLLANTLNRGELSTLRSENERLKAQNGSEGSSLNDSEINATIAKADQNVSDLTIQRNVGVAIYRYAAMKQDVALLQQSVRILTRAFDLEPDDYDVMLTLGNAHFDIGYFSKDNNALAKSREFYSKALAVKADDVNVRTDVGLTYFLETPPDYARSITEFRRSLDKDPKHEKTLQFMIQAMAKQSNYAEASKYLEQLRAVNPQNKALQELTAMLSDQQPPG